MARRNLVRIEGLDQLRDAVGAIDAQVRKGIRRAVEKSTEAVRDDAQQRARVNTGQLRDEGIEAAVDSDGLGGDVGFTRDGFYGTFHEFGTSKHPAQPMLAPAAEAERQKFPQRVIDEVKRALGA